MPYNPCWEYILHPQRCAKKKITPSLLTSLSPRQYQTACMAKQKWGFSEPPAWDPLCCQEGTGVLRETFTTHCNRSHRSPSVIGCGELGDSNSPCVLWIPRSDFR